MNSIEIAGRKVDRSEPVFIVVEVAQAHDGSLGMAHKFIDLAKASGADAIKFQTHIASEESTPSEPFRIKFTTQDKTRYDYWKRMEFKPEQWKELYDHASEAGLIFLSSPFSVKAVEMLDKIGVPAWKVGSGEVWNRILLEKMAETGKPVLLSSGMSPWSELDRMVAQIKEWGNELLVYQCTSAYPCPPEKLGLDNIDEIEKRYSVPAGFSDHSGKIYPAIAAVARGASSVEVHAAMSRYCFGPDVPVSLVPDELFQMVEGIRFIEKSRVNSYSKDGIADELENMRSMFGKSVYANCDIKKGAAFNENNLGLKKPGGGFGPDKYKELIGKIATKDISKDKLIEEGCFK